MSAHSPRERATREPTVEGRSRPGTAGEGIALPARRRAARLGLTLTVLSAVLGVLAASFATWPGDRALAPAVRDLGDPFAAAAIGVNELHYFGTVLAIVGVLVLAAWRRHGDALWVIVLAIAGRLALHPLRELIDRPRPSGDAPGVALAAGPSFPSGHVLTAMLALGLWFVLAPALVPPRWVPVVRVVAVVGVALTGFARVWAGRHWPSDTVGGVIWMTAIFALVVAVAPAVNRAVRGAFRRAR